MLPDCPDDVLLDELSVIVTAGWELPMRPNRELSVRHLLLLTNVDSTRSFRQAAQRLLQSLDDALRSADDDLLGEDERTGCRILLGVHPAYRTTASPTDRRSGAAERLVPKWQEQPPRDRAGTFQRRHQRSVLRQILVCLREHYGQDGASDHAYDIVRVSRWHTIDNDRQLIARGETAEYRVRQDGLGALELLESNLDSENLESARFSVETVEGNAPVTLEHDDIDPTKPGFHSISLRLPRLYQAGEVINVAWIERLTYGPEPPDWRRYWVTVTGLNDGFELEMSVTFENPVQQPDACWWFSAEQITDPGEIGPDSGQHLLELSSSASASHIWRPSETERRRQYGLNWVWLDTDEDQADWAAALRDSSYVDREGW